MFKKSVTASKQYCYVHTPDSAAVLQEQQPQTVTLRSMDHLNLQLQQCPRSFEWTAELDGEVIADSPTEPAEEPQPSGKVAP